MNTEGKASNWKQEPLVWLLIAIPAAAVIMGIVMLTLAIKSYSGLVIDDYYKHGKQINRVLARDRFAHELGLGHRCADQRVRRFCGDICHQSILAFLREYFPFSHMKLR